MTKLAPWAAVVLFGAGVVSAQSLAEVAKKEKDRRARADRGEPAPVFGAEELSRARGDRVSVTGRTPDERATATGEEPESKVAAGPELTEAEIREYRETWRRVWAERLEAAETAAEKARDDAFQCRAAGHYFFVPLGIDCDGVYERLAIAEYRLKETRQNRYNWELLLPERQRPPPSN